MISPEEQKDLELGLVKVAQIQENTWSLMWEYRRMSPDELRHSGQRTQEEAIVNAFDRAQKEIEAVWKAFTKKWPDK